jgi:hypothetical protein
VVLTSFVNGCRWSSGAISAFLIGHHRPIAVIRRKVQSCRVRPIFVSMLATLLAQPAYAVCTTASLDEDYRQADVVVRVRVVAETYVIDDEVGAAYRAKWGDYSPVTLHRLRVVEVFKGKPGPAINLFEEVSSGRYGVSFGKEYLLFLTYYRPFPGRGSAARGAMYVRHTCGQTKPWSEVKSVELARLKSLRRRR